MPTDMLGRSGDGDRTPPDEEPLTPEQCDAGLAEAERIIRRSAGYYFGDALVEFAPEFQSLALRALASQRAARARAEEDAEQWRAFETLTRVAGAGWSVSHPRKEGDSFHVGFTWPMNYDEVMDAVQRGGLGFAPTLAIMLQNAAAALRASGQPEAVTP